MSLSCFRSNFQVMIPRKTISDPIPSKPERTLRSDPTYSRESRFSGVSKAGNNGSLLPGRPTSRHEPRAHKGNTWMAAIGKAK